MRKLLLTTTALIAAGALTTAASADVSISGSYKWSYDERDSGIEVAGASEDRMYSEQNIAIKFSNKTDSGLTISMISALNTEGAGGTSTTAGAFKSDDNSISISGGFGTIQLGSDDGAGDKLAFTAHDIFGTPDALHGDLPAFHRSAGTGNLGDDNADLPTDIDDESNITYMLPKMGGLSIGASYRDAGSGAAENADETSVAMKYEFSSGDVNGSLHYAQHSQDGGSAGDDGLDASSMGLKVSMGNITAGYATANKDVTSTVETSITDFGAHYKLSDALSIAAVQTEVDENVGGETLDVTSFGATYTIASGLTASISYHDYDYQKGTSNETSDDGSNTTLSIVAKF
jgi:hypothetical protein